MNRWSAVNLLRLNRVVTTARSRGNVENNLSTQVLVKTFKDKSIV